MYTNILSQPVLCNIFGTIWEYIKIALGWIMQGCYSVLDLIGIDNLAACIILFTIVIYSLLLPMQIKNAKFQKLNFVMNPEIQAISKKYKNKTDNDSRMKQQQELSDVYERYGTSPTGGCLNSFIQLPILFAVYRVLYNVPNYVRSISKLFQGLIAKTGDISGFSDKFLEMAKASDNILLTNSVRNIEKVTSGNLPNIFYQFRSTDWKTFTDAFPSIEKVINSTRGTLDHVNNFFGVSIAETPSLILKNNWSAHHYGFVAIAILIPVLSGVAQWLSSKVVQQPETDKNNTDDTAAAMASSMKMMMVVMPIFSIYICYTLPLGIGIYWTMSAVYRTISQLVINKRMEKIPVETLIAKNQEKINKKRKKKGLPPKQVSQGARINTRNIKPGETNVASNKNKEEIRRNASESNKSYTSIRDRVNMVQDYNERNKKK